MVPPPKQDQLIKAGLRRLGLKSPSPPLLLLLEAGFFAVHDLPDQHPSTRPHHHSRT